MPMNLYDRSGGTTVVGKCAPIVSPLIRGARARLAAIRHRFDSLSLVTGRDRAARSGSLVRSPVAMTSTRLGEPIRAFDDGGARSIDEAHDDPAAGESLHAGAIL